MTHLLFRNKILKEAHEFNPSGFFMLEEVPEQDFINGIDVRIDKTLQRISELEISSITIPVSITDNFLEFSGIRLGHHIRLSSYGNLGQVPLFFIGTIDQFSLLSLNTLANILLTPKVYYFDLAKMNFLKVQEKIDEISREPHPTFEIGEYLEKIIIDSPANYESHHSIANEWALARYFSMFEKNIQNEDYKSLSSKVSELDYLKNLHFKYVEAKSTRQKFHPRKHLFIPKFNNINGLKIALVDDDLKKGWLEFYKYLFESSGAKTISFTEYKNEESKVEFIEELKVWAQSIIENENPIDLFVIDLRLHPDDFIENDFSKLSGVNLIKFIKGLNPGIQIVVSTASNKVWSYQECLRYGVRHYSIKESPETFNTRNESKKLLVHFVKQIEEAASSIYLAQLFRDIKSIQKNNWLSKERDLVDFNNLVFLRNGLLDQIMSLMIIDSNNDSILNQVLLLLFQILENYCDLSYVGSFELSRNASTGFVWMKDKSKKDIFYTIENVEYTFLELEYDCFAIQVDKSKKYPNSFIPHKTAKLYLNKPNGIEATTLTKIISVFYFREGLKKEDIEKLLKLRFYRSNVAAHLTGNVDPNYKINYEDLIFFVNILKKIFIK